MIARTLLFLFLFAFPLNATVILPLTDTDLVQKSDRIVLGTILSARSFIHPVYNIYVTEFKLNVEEAFRGDTDDLVFLVPGGLTEAGGGIAEGTPDIREDARILVFLERVEDHYVPMGLKRGVFYSEGTPGDFDWTFENRAAGLVSLEGDSFLPLKDREYRGTELIRFIRNQVKPGKREGNK